VNETQKTISDWAMKTFGMPSSLPSIAARANIELAELISAMEKGDTGGVAEEAADVVIILYRLADRAGITLHMPSDQGALDFNRGCTAAMLNSMAQVMYAAQSLEALRITNRGYVMIHDIVSLDGMVEHLAAIAHDFGEGLQEEINRKMKINRQRKWQVDKHGMAQHIEEGQ
jgi:NTP pyrophosphatase (non-canonical NTP hydrolase)